MPKGGSLGGPLIESKDPRALAAVLDVDEDFADRIQHWTRLKSPPVAPGDAGSDVMDQ